MKKVINARMTVIPEKLDLFLSLAATMVQKSNAEPGCILYKTYQEVGNPNSFIFYEVYENQQAIDDHTASVHFKSFKGQMDTILVEKSCVEIF